MFQGQTVIKKLKNIFNRFRDRQGVLVECHIVFSIPANGDQVFSRSYFFKFPQKPGLFPGIKPKETKNRFSIVLSAIFLLKSRM